MSSLRERVEGLIAKWRDDGARDKKWLSNFMVAGAMTMEQCADELAAALAAEGQGDELLMRGEEGWLLELSQCNGDRDKLSSVLRAFYANLKTQALLTDTTADKLLKDAMLGLKVLRAIGQSRAYKTVGKVEMPSWGKPVMETCETLIEEIELHLLRNVKVVQSAAAPSLHKEGFK